MPIPCEFWVIKTRDGRTLTTSDTWEDYPLYPVKFNSEETAWIHAKKLMEKMMLVLTVKKG